MREHKRILFLGILVLIAAVVGVVLASDGELTQVPEFSSEAEMWDWAYENLPPEVYKDARCKALGPLYYSGNVGDICTPLKDICPSCFYDKSEQLSNDHKSLFMCLNCRNIHMNGTPSRLRPVLSK